jgi:UDP-N-acetylglucosamine transferase subunit ALG13
MDANRSVQDEQSPVVLVCPLDWGLGHATRCVPLIRAFLEEGARVIVAADGDALAFLRQSFPGRVEFRVLPGRSVVYPRNTKRLSLVLGLLRQLPGLLLSVKREHARLRMLIRETGARFVISDNRYGLFSDLATCVFIGHQLYLRVPGPLSWAGVLANRLNHWLINRFDHCWIPDLPGSDNLSGALSHPAGYRKPLKIKKIRYIGPLSRFTGPGADEMVCPLPEGFPSSFYLAMLSGPEPQRSLLEDELNAQFATLDHAVVVLRGVVHDREVRSPRDPAPPGDQASRKDSPTPGEAPSTNGKAPPTNGKALPILRFDHLGDGPMAWLIRHARLVICRPGYSTLMDLAVFGKKAVVVPTPGQTEQEYLGERMGEKGWVCCVPQTGFSLAVQVQQAEGLAGIPRHSGSEASLPRLRSIGLGHCGRNHNDKI